MQDLNELLYIAIRASYEAGAEIMKVKNSGIKGERRKKDKSYVTDADINANNVITQNLVYTGIPIISEESNLPKSRLNEEYIWIVDPLDGTSEFVADGNEFTVNIALVKNHKVILGVVYVPVTNELYYASEEIGSYKFICEIDYEINDEDVTNYIKSLIYDSLQLPYTETDIYTIVASKRNLNKETSFFIENLSDCREVKYENRSSSLKMCVVAEGNADIYPRMSKIWEWDTAAAHAIVKFAGKNIYDMSGEELQYNKSNLLNSYFIVK